MLWGAVVVVVVAPCARPCRAVVVVLEATAWVVVVVDPPCSVEGGIVVLVAAVVGVPVVGQRADGDEDGDRHDEHDQDGEGS